MRYSIVIPAYKRSNLITQCLESIERQIAKPLKLLLLIIIMKKMNQKN